MVKTVSWSCLFNSSFRKVFIYLFIYLFFLYHSFLSYFPFWLFAYFCIHSFFRIPIFLSRFLPLFNFTLCLCFFHTCFLVCFFVPSFQSPYLFCSLSLMKLKIQRSHTHTLFLDLKHGWQYFTTTRAFIQTLRKRLKVNLCHSGSSPQGHAKLFTLKVLIVWIESRCK